MKKVMNLWNLMMMIVNKFIIFYFFFLRRKNVSLSLFYQYGNKLGNHLLALCSSSVNGNAYENGRKCQYDKITGINSISAIIILLIFFFVIESIIVDRNNIPKINDGW